MRRVIPTLLLAGALSACGVFNGEDDPQPAPEPFLTKAECDQFSAQAIETEEVTDARRLAARAAECYAAVEQRGGV